MKNNNLLTVIACASLASGLALPAAAAETGLYFNAEGGANVAQDIDIKYGPLSEKAELNVGTRFGAGVGYNLNKFVGVEFDTGVVINKFSHSDSFLEHLPFMVNGVFRYPIDSKLEAYVGVGVGGVYNFLSIDDGSVNDDDAEVSFGWQGMAGLRYKFKENMSLGIGYKYLYSADTDYNIEGVTVKLDNSHNHSVGVVFNMTF